MIPLPAPPLTYTDDIIAAALVDLPPEMEPTFVLMELVEHLRLGRTLRGEPILDKRRRN